MHSETRKIITSFIAPFIFVLIMVGVKLLEIFLPADFVSWGILPRNITGLKGILTAPFIHADWEHLSSNAIPIIVCGAALFYFYKEIAWKVLLIVYLCGGFWLWLGGRENYHIGASNIVYGLACFLFFSGIIRRHTGLIAVSLLVVFLYGSMVWGLLPVLEKISWEGHLFGTLAGILCAVVFRKQGPQRKQYDWENEDDEINLDPINPNDFNPEQQKGILIQYDFKPKNEINNEPEKN